MESQMPRKFKTIKMVCEQCQKTYLVIPSRVYAYSTVRGWRKRRFCSKPCSIIWERKHFNSPEVRKNRSKNQLGEKNVNWRGGKCNWNKKLRSTTEYKSFIKERLKEADYNCTLCSQHGGNLCVHHIKQVALYPSLIMSKENTQVLCYSCHTTTDSFLYVPKKAEIQEVVNTYGKQDSK